MMNDAIDDLKLIEKANLTHNIKFVASSAVSSLRYLREFAQKRGIRMEDIRPEDIIADFAAADRQVCELDDALRKQTGR